MNLHNISTIARFESKLLRRSWLFRIFACLAVIIISFATLVELTYTLYTYSEKWPKIALTSLMPFYSTYYYNIVQSVIVIFLAGNFLNRSKKLDTAEVIYVRPMSNADFIIGKTWGIIKTFLSLNLISLAITAFFNIVLNQSPFSVFPYLFYFFTISLPSLLFVLGLSFTVMCLLKNQAVTFIIMLGIVGVVFFYLPDYFFGVFDFFGINIPTIFSDITGHSNLQIFLVQRSIFLLLGIGLICFTIALLKRLPHRPWKVVLVCSFGALFLLTGVAAGIYYVVHYHDKLNARSEYATTFNKYAATNNVSILTHNLTITPTGSTLEGESILQIHNKLSKSLDTIILYLNPSLKIISVTSNDTEIPYTRENQTIIIHQSIQSQDTMPLNISYNGHINEAICYTDVLKKDYLNTQLYGSIYRLGKRYAWLEETFTLLTPECLWYPSAVAPAHPASPYHLKKNFVEYILTVNYDGDKTVLSQGKSKRVDDQIIFTNQSPLPGISLTIAEYERKSLTIDSTEYEILHFKGNDYFSEHFTDLSDTLVGLIRDFKNDIEIAKGRNYPFHKFVIAETPVQFASYTRNWKGHTEYVMPEIVFVPEQNVTQNHDFTTTKTRYDDWKRHDSNAPDSLGMTMRILQDFLRSIFINENMYYNRKSSINSTNITPMFFSHTGFVHSEEYPMLDVVMNIMQNSTSTPPPQRGRARFINDQQRANTYLSDHSFQSAISDAKLKPEIFYELLKLKSNALKNYINTQISLKEFNSFLTHFFQQNSFTDVPFETFRRSFENTYGIDLNPFLHQWYTEDHSPSIYIKDVDANKVVMDEMTKFQIKFKVYNPSDVDAIISAQPNQGGGRDRRKGGEKSTAAPEQFSYFIPKGEASEIKIIVDNRPASIIINTNISHNLPTAFSFNFSKIEHTVTDTIEGIFPIDTNDFKPNPDEIIIDNSDKGFKIIESNTRTKLKDFVKKEKESENDRYKNFNPWWAPSKWTLIAADYYYGETIHSALYKTKGSGNNSIIWSADIPKSGHYELFIWNPKTESSNRHYYSRSSDRNQTYTVEYDGETENMTIDLEQEAGGWVSLESFYLPAGVTTVTLTDKVSGSYVIADAIKFSLIDK